MTGLTQSSQPSTTASFLWAAALVEGRVTLRITRYVGVTLGLGIAIPLIRDQFQGGSTTAPVTLFQPSAVSGRLSLGPELRF
jgi:hypothetical protein